MNAATRQPKGTTDAPFSRLFRVEDARDAPVDLAIEAKDSERAAVAAQDGIPDLAELSAKLRIRAAGRGRYEVTGEIRARLTQICVVTLDPFETTITEDVGVIFAPPADAEKAAARFAARKDDVDPGPDLEEPPDPIIDGRIDLGVLAVEFLILGLDPHPRKPGVEFAGDVGLTPETPDESPFAALAKLRDPKAD